MTIRLVYIIQLISKERIKLCMIVILRFNQTREEYMLTLPNLIYYWQTNSWAFLIDKNLNQQLKFHLVIN